MVCLLNNPQDVQSLNHSQGHNAENNAMMSGPIVPIDCGLFKLQLLNQPGYFFKVPNFFLVSEIFCSDSSGV